MVRKEWGRHFRPGRLIATRGVMETVPQVELMSAFSRHIACDWGELCHTDCEANEQALQSGGRLLSAYKASNGRRFLIITEADRSVTPFLLPEEY